ncbi:MAG: hypothetical protein IGR92_10015 [Leptolyngbyaceae cyanobacterium T60_A2020_046]|nr:hypothetical protein [Leptolyngbyaceae cyanobacterium T60_A2020_046]
MGKNQKPLGRDRALGAFALRGNGADVQTVFWRSLLQRQFCDPAIASGAFTPACR